MSRLEGYSDIPTHERDILRSRPRLIGLMAVKNEGTEGDGRLRKVEISSEAICTLRYVWIFGAAS